MDNNNIFILTSAIHPQFMSNDRNLARRRELLVIGAQVLRHTSPTRRTPFFVNICHESEYRSRMVEVALPDDATLPDDAALPDVFHDHKGLSH